MREVEQDVVRWRRDVTLALGGDRDAAEELEGHLRDAVEALVRRGVAPAEAFRQARARLGSPAEVAAEFARAAAPVRWWPAAVIGVAVAASFAAFCWEFLLPAARAGRDPLLIGHVTALTGGCFAALAAGLLGTAWLTRWLVRPLPAGHLRSLARALVAANAAAAGMLAVGLALGMAWARGHHGRAWSNDPREVLPLVAALWCAALAVIGGCSPRHLHRVAMLSVVGLSVAAWAWFGPLALPSPDALHHYGWTPLWLLLLSLSTAATLAVAALGLLPPARLSRRAG